MVVLKSIADIEAYAIRRREEGEGYSSIKNFLYSRWKNKSDVSSTIQKVVQLERQQLLVVNRHNKDYSAINFMMGAFTILLGVILTYALWERGWVASVSVVMIGAGFIGIFKK